ncbi:MAG: flavodoxin family protein [Pedobacter sp.]|nr:MAG: flavodoxin family protein [Pedobacter sp.]
MKILVIVTHPDLDKSLINKRWVAELEKHPELYTIHNLHQQYPNGEIDILREQELVEKYDKIVFQFPVYWFSCPALLKKWLDEVLIHGWAYGSKSGYKVLGKKIALAMTVGVEEFEYRAGEKYKYSLEELTRPFELSFEYVKADYQPFFAYYGIDVNSSAEHIENSVQPYLAFLDAF